MQLFWSGCENANLLFERKGEMSKVFCKVVIKVAALKIFIASTVSANIAHVSRDSTFPTRKTLSEMRTKTHLKRKVLRKD